jgi:hypothetical protein
MVPHADTAHLVCYRQLKASGALHHDLFGVKLADKASLLHAALRNVCH